MLHIGFHEFGHIAAGHSRDSQEFQRYKHEWRFRSYWEDQANRTADAWIEAILNNNGRLYQPNYLGVVSLIEKRRRLQIRSEQHNRRMSNSKLKDYRCHVTGGQLSVHDVFLSVFKEPFSLDQQKMYKLIHQAADDIARVYRDGSGRMHRFWVWGDLQIIAGRLRSSFNGLTDAEIEKRYRHNRSRVQISFYGEKSGRQPILRPQ
jgi:hypothetical protein